MGVGGGGWGWGWEGGGVKFNCRESSFVFSVCQWRPASEILSFVPEESGMQSFLHRRHFPAELSPS